MQNIFKYCLTLSSIIIALQANAQYQGNVYEATDSAEIIKNGLVLAYPWLGGMNSLMLTEGDLNQDNIKDVVVYDHLNNLIFPFIKKVNGTTVTYSYEKKYALNFPQIIYYLILKDYNCDNIPDLFHRGAAGVSVYKGYYQNNELKFTAYKELYTPGNFGPINCYVPPNDIPVITDMDSDGDLDVVAMDVLGNYISYFKNTRVENNLPCDSIAMVYATSCWGNVVQSTFQKKYILNVTCKGFTPSVNNTSSDAKEDYYDPSATAGPGSDGTFTATDSIADGKPKGTRHTGNCMLAVDEDGDGDKDMFMGSIGYNDIQFLINGGTAASAYITNQDSIYDAPNPIFCPQFPALSEADMDNDGKIDLLIAPHEVKSNTQFFYNNKLLFYKNIGTTTNPDYALTQKDILFDNTIDIGLNSYPTFFDYNKDGKLDLFVGGSGEFDSTTFLLQGQLHYFENKSTPGNIKFEYITNDFLNLSTLHYKGMYPHFADITGDGIEDLMFGTDLGKLVVYKNVALSNGNIPVFTLLTDSFFKINSSYLAPCMFDVNFDGKKDLVLGLINGNLDYLEDTSTIAGVKKFYELTGSLGILNVGTQGYAAPTYTKVDSNKREQLIIGNRSGVLKRYDSLQANIYGPYTLLDTMYSYIKVQERSVPAFADIDNDGAIELVVGNKMGGLKMFKQKLLVGKPDSNVAIDSITAINYLVKQSNAFKVYPNPTSHTVTIESTTMGNSIEVKLYNALGKQVLNNKNKTGRKIEINVHNLPQGVYFYQINNEHFIQTGTLSKLQ